MFGLSEWLTYMLVNCFVGAIVTIITNKRLNRSDKITKEIKTELITKVEHSDKLTVDKSDELKMEQHGLNEKINGHMAKVLELAGLVKLAEGRDVGIAENKLEQIPIIETLVKEAEERGRLAGVEEERIRNKQKL